MIIHLTESFDWHDGDIIYCYAAGHDIDLPDEICEAILEAGAGYLVEDDDFNAEDEDEA